MYMVPKPVSTMADIILLKMKEKKQGHLRRVVLSMYMIADTQIMVAPSVYKRTCSLQSDRDCVPGVLHADDVFLTVNLYAGYIH